MAGNNTTGRFAPRIISHEPRKKIVSLWQRIDIVLQVDRGYLSPRSILFENCNAMSILSFNLGFIVKKNPKNEPSAQTIET